MVVVSKPSGAVRICVDYRQLNESILREVRSLPKVDATLAQLAGTSIFSKVDVNCGFIRRVALSIRRVAKPHNLHNSVWVVCFQ